MSGKNKPDTLLENLHRLIEEKKEIDRISWDNLGSLISYSGVGIKKALNNRGLSLTKLEDIIVKLELTKQATKLGLKLSDNKPFNISNKSEKVGLLRSKAKENVLKDKGDLATLEDLCLANWDALMKSESIQDKVELTAMKDINKILDERIAIILKHMKE